MWRGLYSHCIERLVGGQFLGRVWYPFHSVAIIIARLMIVTDSDRLILGKPSSIDYNVNYQV